VGELLRNFALTSIQSGARLWAAMAQAGLIGYAARSVLPQAEVIMSRPVVATKFVVVAILAVLCSVRSSAQTPATSTEDPARHEAFQLYDAGKYAEAMPLLEKIVADHPSDLVAKEHWAFSMVGYAATLPDPAERKKARARARVLAGQLKEAGDNSNLLQIMLALPEDGSEPSFSDRKDVDDVMKAAEADFGRGDLDKAREGYVHALALDPENYDAALFAGDACFKQHSYGQAGEWFARAIQINPNRETAYRYWGDALTSSSKNDEARGKFIDAVVAEPYSNKAWMGLRQWVDRNKVKLNVLVLKDKAATQSDGKNATITLDPNMLNGDSSGTAAWIVYGGARLTWQQEKFKKEFPNETVYRRSLKEEAEALDTMVSVIAEDAKSKKKAKSMDPSLVALVQLDHAGLLEPFVLFNRADAGIAKDYPAYRAAHRDLLRRYLDEYVVPKTP
jgi:tetratricopeptide (TPR) repeat protein